MSKIGVHSIIGPRKGYGEFLKRLQGASAVSSSSPLAIMVVDDFGPVKEAQDILGASRVLGIGRVNSISDQYGNDVDLQAWEPGGFDNATEAAKAYYALVKPKWLQNPHIKIWGAFNEFSAHWAWQGSFYQALMDLLEPDGYKLVLYNFSSGNPPGPASGGIDPEIIKQIVPSLREAKQRGHYLGLHEYGGIDNADGAMRNAAPFHTLRHRWLREQLRPFDADAHMVITESGPNGGGFFSGVEPFMNDVRWFDGELFKDSYVVGATLFTVGKWQDGAGNFQAALPALGDYIATTPTPPPPEDEPPPPAGRMPYPYARVAHLLPQDTTDAEYEKVYAIAKPNRESILFSANDAFIDHPDLTKRTVSVWAVERWGGQKALESFVLRHYPPLPAIVYRSF